MRFKVSYLFALLAAALVAFNTTSCRKVRTLTTGGVLTFSNDTLKFDTVFTAAGSFTRGMLIYNKQDEPITISSVRLKSGAASFFHLNVDGFAGNTVTNLKLAPHDSLYVFATVNIDPTDSNNPFIITDQLIATLNGNDFSVVLSAYGQNAHYVIGDSLKTNTTWLTDRPYVVEHACVIGQGVTLNIPKGCKVYMHQDARFFVYGTMNVCPSGITGQDSVVFQGDRLDRVYFGYLGYPGEWGGIYVVNGGLANINNAVIKNCGGATPYYNYSIQGAAVEVDTGGKLVMTNSIVRNSIGHGIFSFEGNAVATNCLIHSCGGECLAIILGGVDSFTNCTFANYGNSAVGLDHINNPTVGIVNWLQISQTQYAYADLSAVLRNCIVWGSLDSELVADTSGSPATVSAYLKFDHCVLKKGGVNEPFAQMVACQTADPGFKNGSNGDYHITGTSSAQGNGTTTFAPLSYDLDGKPRTGAPDIGCYVWQ